jgi:hypothetical protein
MKATLRINYLIVHLSRIQIAENARMWFGVFFLQKMIPKGRRFDSSSGQITIFPMKYTKNVKSMLNAVESTATVI